MSWNNRAIAQASDLSSYAQLFDSIAQGPNPFATASYQCNSTLIGVMIAIANNGAQLPQCVQSKTYSAPFNGSGFQDVTVNFDNPVTPAD